VLRRLLPLLVLALCAATMPARAQTAPAAFVDLGDDGVYDPGDIPLDQFLAPDSIGFNQWVAQGAYKPTGRPVGVVIQSRWLVGTGVYHQIVVSGHIRVHGDIVATRDETSVAFTTLGGDVDIAPRVKLSGRGDLSFQTLQGGRITVGDGVQLGTRGETATALLDSSGPLTLGTGVRGTLQGGGYADIMLLARNGITVGDGLAVKAPNHGGFHIIVNGDLDLTNASIRAGYIDLEAVSDAAHPLGAHVHLADSSLLQSYRNGDFRILAGVNQRTRTFAPDAILLDHTSVRTKDGLPLYVPDPLIVP
jgi:hypothetical protein